MAVVDEKFILENLKKDRISPVYFIFGEDHFLIKQTVSKIVKKTVTSYYELNYDVHKFGASAQDIYNSAATLPLLSDKRCVSVCDYDFDKCSASEFQKMTELLENENPSTVLVFFFETVTVNQKKLSDRLKKVFKLIEKSNGTVCCMGYRTNAELISALKRAAEKRGCGINSSVAGYMLQTCGSDLFTLTNEIEKLCSYKPNSEITADMVDKVCSKTIEASVYNLSKMILAKNIKGALKVLDDLFFMNVGTGIILYNLTASVLDLARAKAAVNNGIKAEEIASDFSYPKNVVFRLTNAQRNVRYLSDRQIDLMLKKVLDCDKKLKSGTSDEKVLLERLIVDLTVTLQKGV